MVIGRNPNDGRVIVMAREEALPPLLRSADGTWGPAQISGQELDAFEDITDEAERQSLLKEAKTASALAILNELLDAARNPVDGPVLVADWVAGKVELAIDALT